MTTLSPNECPRCETGSSVAETRTLPDGLRRRRVCKSCRHRWTTYEVLAADEQLQAGHGSSLVVLTTVQLRTIRAALAMIDGLVGKRSRPRGSHREQTAIADLPPSYTEEPGVP